MKKLYQILLIFTFQLICISTTHAQTLKSDDQFLKNKYIFKLNLEQNKSLLKNGINNIDSTFFYNLIDSVKTTESWDNKNLHGNFLEANFISNEVNITYISKPPFVLKPINNLKNLEFILIDDQGKFINNAKVFLGNRRICRLPIFSTILNYKIISLV